MNKTATGFDFLLEDPSLLETPVRFRFELAIFLSAYSLLQYQKSDDYWGGSDDVNIMNFLCLLLSSLVGVDVTEEESWTQYTNRATSEEIAKFNIDQLIKSLPSLVPKHTKLYAFAFEAGDLIDSLPELIALKDNYHFSLATEATTDADSGWSVEEVETINSLQLFEAVENFSHSQNTLIRIR